MSLFYHKMKLILSLYVIFSKTYLSVRSPCNSPSPAPIEELLNEEEAPCLEVIYSFAPASTTENKNISDLDVNPSKKNSKTRRKTTRKRSRRFTDEERRLKKLECTKKWKAKKKAEDSDYLARAARRHRARKVLREQLELPLKDSPGRPVKNRSSP